MKKITVVVLFLAFFLSRNSYSQNTYEFLRVGMSPRASALGGTFVSNDDDANVIFYNPAGLNSLEGNPASISYVKHLLDINLASVAFSTDFTDVGRFGAAIQYINYGSFDQADANGTKIGTFNAGEAALIIGYSNNLALNFNYGVNLKLIYSNIADRNSTAIAMDYGLHYSLPEDQIEIGFSVLNVGTQLKSYYNTKEDLPLDFTVGVSKSLEHLPLRLSLDFHELNEKHESFASTLKDFSIGAEFTLSKVLKLRLGYNNQNRQDWEIGSTPGIAGFNIGFGLHIATYQFDYGFSSMGLIGGLHRIGISTNI